MNKITKITICNIKMSTKLTTNQSMKAITQTTKSGNLPHWKNSDLIWSISNPRNTSFMMLMISWSMKFFKMTVIERAVAITENPQESLFKMSSMTSTEGTCVKIFVSNNLSNKWKGCRVSRMTRATDSILWWQTSTAIRT